ncbi:MAG: putative peptidoglycan glycosyltransferase FtsW [Alphaproteobacteria bacterium]|nr:putative peptidoglycan glycosyltransferase FtsW [Alphaproteobacteria bacterium]
MLNFSRTNRSILAEWWWTVDRLLLSFVIGLALVGLVFSMAASPLIAVKLGLDDFYFVKRQGVFFLIGSCLMVGISLFDARQLRRISLFAVFSGFGLMVYTLFYGREIKGALRWIEIFGFSFQPSEFVKPFFIVLSAWFFVEGLKRTGIPAVPLAIALLSIFLFLLIQQPDIGQAILVLFVWGGLFFMADMTLLWIIVLFGICVSGGISAYLFVPHVNVRINSFLDPSSSGNYQVGKALESVKRGGWLGRGPGEGKVKDLLPDSHTDFIFAVTAEEFGIVVCLGLLSVFCFIVLRILFFASRQKDPFARFVVAGLAIMFGFQAFINMGVNLALLPAKGMTLPFISAGGSSMLSNFLAMGMILGLTRHHARTD